MVGEGVGVGVFKPLGDALVAPSGDGVESLAREAVKVTVEVTELGAVVGRGEGEVDMLDPPPPSFPTEVVVGSAPEGVESGERDVEGVEEGVEVEVWEVRLEGEGRVEVEGEAVSVPELEAFVEGVEEMEGEEEGRGERVVEGEEVGVREAQEEVVKEGLVEGEGEKEGVGVATTDPLPPPFPAASAGEAEAPLAGEGVAKSGGEGVDRAPVWLGEVEGLGESEGDRVEEWEKDVERVGKGVRVPVMVEDKLPPPPPTPPPVPTA